jgi:hypothetical protein
MIEAFEPPVDDEDEFDIYDALGLNAPVSGGGSPNDPVEAYDPLAAFMEDEEEHLEAPVADLFSNQTEDGNPGASHHSVEVLLATLARELLDEERLTTSLSGGEADLTSLKVERDREAYHLSLIVDMGGHLIKPFATVVADQDSWKPLSPPKGLSAKWKPLYEALCSALSDALKAQERPTPA